VSVCLSATLNEIKAVISKR